MKVPSYVVFGASGDLARRYLLPALKNIPVQVIPISRRDYPNLKNIVPKEREKIFHLAIPPEAVPGALELIATTFGNDDVKILLEKPFGEDLASAQNLVVHAEKFFQEEQIFRVDHFLGKDSAQNITRGSWRRENVAKLEILASEKIGIEGRVNFYERVGALRDMIQNHLLELAALTLSPQGQGLSPEVRHRLLQSLAIVCDITKSECVKRGQYEGYREEVGNPSSLTETFVELNLVSDSSEWRGVEIKVATGKALSEKFTEVRIYYRDGRKEILSVHPEPDAYEKVIRSALRGEHELFVSSEEALESWRILDAVQESWKTSEDALIIYQKGTELNELISR